ncbi:putative ribonuclease H1 [Mycena crocata]|nr:putative ribonuclease H1 [Mycena crocata]
MAYHLEACVDGACRGNGRLDAVAGAGIWVPILPGALHYHPLPSYPRPTNQRAELTAVILALTAGLEKQFGVCVNNLHQPFFILTVRTDSQYAVDCMKWVYGRIRFGWFKSTGDKVENQDLIQKAHDMRCAIQRRFGGGKAIFNWISREKNQTADWLANKACDETEHERLADLYAWS